jgi:hypothetical protein
MHLLITNVHPQVTKADVVYIDHGANFGGSLNLFGGANKEVYDRINLVMSCENIVSLDWDMPDYGEMLKKRLEAPTTYKGITPMWCNAISKRIRSITSLKQKDLKTDGVIFGDSHTIAFSDSGDRVYRTDGKTLFGSIRKGLRQDIQEPLGRLTISLGSIDIRHHILRHPGFSLKYNIKGICKRR